MEKYSLGQVNVYDRRPHKLGNPLCSSRCREEYLQKSEEIFQCQLLYGNLVKVL